SGQYIIATAENVGLALSNDCGVTWNMSMGVVRGRTVMSADGQYVTGRETVVEEDYFVHYSSDYGKTWLNTTERILGKQCGNMWYGWNFIVYGSKEYGRTFYTAPLEVSKEGIFNWTARSYAEDNDDEFLYCD